MRFGQNKFLVVMLVVVVATLTLGILYAFKESLVEVIPSLDRTVPLNGNIKHDATVLLVGWVVEGREVPGYSEPYPDAQHMDKMERFYVIVDYLPDDVIISNDPRVVRVTLEELQEISELREFNDGSDHLSLSLVEEQNNEYIVISLVNIFDPLAAHGYVFTFEIKDGEIKGDGVLAWVS